MALRNHGADIRNLVEINYALPGTLVTEALASLLPPGRQFRVGHSFSPEVYY